MQRENERVARKYKQQERDRIAKLVSLAESMDPRVQAEKEASGMIFMFRDFVLFFDRFAWPGKEVGPSGRSSQKRAGPASLGSRGLTPTWRGASSGSARQGGGEGFAASPVVSREFAVRAFHC